jgi:D-aminopeptidase
MEELTENDKKEFVRIMNLSHKEIIKELNELGISEQQVKDSIVKIKKLVADKIEEEKKPVAQVIRHCSICCGNVLNAVMKTTLK